MPEPQTRTRGVGVEVAQEVAAIEAKTHDEERILAQLRSQMGEHRLLSAWRQIRAISSNASQCLHPHPIERQVGRARLIRANSESPLVGPLREILTVATGPVVILAGACPHRQD